MFWHLRIRSRAPQSLRSTPAVCLAMGKNTSTARFRICICYCRFELHVLSLAAPCNGEACSPSRSQPAFCQTCHSEVGAEFSKEFRHRVNDGLIRCSDCHNVHAASIESVRRSPEQDQVCFKCHRQLQGPFHVRARSRSYHIPMKTEGCMSCHQPHGSINPECSEQAR